MRGLTFKKKDWIIIAALLALCAVAMLLFLPKKTGNVAIVTYKGRTVAEIALNREGLYPIDGDLSVTLEVKANHIRFINSLCPDHVCEGYGWIGLEGNWAICLPARVTVQIIAG